MQAIQHQLEVVVDEGFLCSEQAKRATQTFVYRFLCHLGLKDVLEAKCFLFRGDGQQGDFISFSALRGTFLLLTTTLK